MILIAYSESEQNSFTILLICSGISVQICRIQSSLCSSMEQIGPKFGLEPISRPTSTRINQIEELFKIIINVWPGIAKHGSGSVVWAELWITIKWNGGIDFFFENRRRRNSFCMNPSNVEVGTALSAIASIVVVSREIMNNSEMYLSVLIVPLFHSNIEKFVRFVEEVWVTREFVEWRHLRQRNVVVSGDLRKMHNVLWHTALS